jgi:hypothetical protein
MKGKGVFTGHEARKIESLINQKLFSKRNEQNIIRNHIRKMGFYMTDFSNKKRYTIADFRNVVIIIQ